MEYVMCDVWFMMCDVPDMIFCKILTLWVKGRPKIPPLGNFRPLSDIPKLIPGGRRMYTISCKASYTTCTFQLKKTYNIAISFF